MKNTALVREMHGSRQGFHQRRGFPFRLRRACTPAQQIAPIDVFQDKERPAVAFADLINPHNVRMLQPGHRFGLDLEALPGRRVRVQTAREHLDGNRPIERTLPGLVDNAHAAPAQLFADLVARYLRRAQQCPKGRRKARPQVAARARLSTL